MGYGKFYIYALIDPRTDKIFYVGRSKHPKQRVKQHINGSKNVPEDEYEGENTYMYRLVGISPWDRKFLKSSNPNKDKTIAELLEIGQSPIVKIIDEWETEKLSNANRLEEAWIAHFFAHSQPLTNRLTSHRMMPSWYKRKGARFVGEPIEYIRQLKAGELYQNLNNTDQEQAVQKKKIPYKKRRYSNWNRINKRIKSRKKRSK